MNRLMSKEEIAVKKIINVIRSCKKLSQMETALNMLNGFINMHRNNREAGCLKAYLMGHYDGKLITINK